MTDTKTVDPLRKRALKGWARRRLNAYLKEYQEYKGELPERVTLWAEDYDLLGGRDECVELVRGRERLPA